MPFVSSIDTITALSSGFEQLASVMAVTLGPIQGPVLNSVGGGRPEILCDSSKIAQQVVELPSRTENVGAMVLRNMTHDLHEKYGDGAATAAVLASAMIRRAVPMIVAETNPMLLRRGIEQATAVAQQALKQQVSTDTDQDVLTGLAASVTADLELSRILGEMFDMLGENGSIVIEPYAAPYLDREFLEGGRWECRPASRLLMPPGYTELTLENVLVAVIDAEIEKFEDIRPALEIAANSPQKLPLLIVARDLKGEALAGVTANHTNGVLTVGAAICYTVKFRISDDLEDIALTVGGEVMLNAKGYRIKPEYLGRARKISLTREWLTIVNGAGDQHAIHQRIAQLRHLQGQVNRTEKDWDRLRMRIARLAGGVGVLKIGAYTERERDDRRERAQKASLMLHLAQEGGVVPGGGVAYLRCIDAVMQAMHDCADEHVAKGYLIVAQALAAPFRQIVRNHGRVDPDVALNEVQRLDDGHGFDVLTGEYARLAERGIWDCFSVASGVLDAAASAANMIITTEVIVSTH